VSVLILCGLVFFAVYFFYFKPVKVSPRSGFRGLDFSSVPEKKLLSVVFGDHARASALMNYELTRAGLAMSRPVAAQAALDRLYADRSR
jgi:hypothetical protein